MNTKKSLLKNYVITVIAAIVLMAIVVAIEADDGLTVLRIACDACFVSGALLLILAALTFVSNGGGFHPFGYLRKRMQYTLTKNSRYLMTYTEYVQSRESRGKANLTHLLVVGAVLVLISLILVFVQ